VVSGARRGLWGVGWNKLAGLYEDLAPLDPNFPFFAELQGSEYRYAQIAAQALDRAYEAWAEAHRRRPITAEEFTPARSRSPRTAGRSSCSTSSSCWE